MEQIIINSNIIFRIMNISHIFSVVIFSSPITKGDDKRSLFIIVGDCRFNTGTTQ